MVSCWERIRGRTVAGLESQEERVACGCETDKEQQTDEESAGECKDRLGGGISTLIAEKGYSYIVTRR